MSVVYVVGGVIVAGLLWLVTGVVRIGAVSRGKAIETRSGEALLLIDLQSVFWDEGPYAEPDKQKAAEVILDEVQQAKAKGHPVVALRQEWSLPVTKVISWLTMKGQGIAGTPGTEIAAPFLGLADREVVKRVQDGFETGALDALLAEQNVGALRIVGLDHNFCVFKTALAAAQRGYGVTVVKNGTLAAHSIDKAQMQMKEHGITQP
ncbi:cysteine hydrolase family protein [Shimia sagamensis]|uniref:Nicotinamidase-related amidase n=1 Tax=Shimia sagamensis TaxID=1566352 RepID=A0ABY1NZF7_9RHOB|nr:isochorismatase family cysteine hydrolase [Shimia sagamensis]SMP22685.1 Nicotinamidase-related amidase [Shimia sagamensis]